MAKLRISALDGEHSGQLLEAPINPKEIVVGKAIPWQQQPHKGPGDLAFESAEPAHMSFELLFDAAESSKSIQPLIDKLNQFSSVDGVLHRPPKVKVVWGGAADAMPGFEGVIEAISIRYVLFAENGVPLRATVDVRLRQAVHLMVRTSSPGPR